MTRDVSDSEALELVVALLCIEAASDASGAMDFARRSRLEARLRLLRQEMAGRPTGIRIVDTMLRALQAPGDLPTARIVDLHPPKTP